MTMSDQFGEMRSLMQHHVFNEVSRSKLCALMKGAWTTNLEAYSELWVGYMTHFSSPL